MAEVVPELILLNLPMPEMDRFEFIATLKKHPEWQSIPVIVITANHIRARPQELPQLQNRSFICRLVRRVSRYPFFVADQ